MDGFYNALQTGLQLGQMARQQQDQREYRNALAQFDPTKPETIKPIMQVKPEVGFQLQGQIQQQAAAQKKQAGLDLGTFRQLLKQAGASPEGWQTAFGAAQSMGLDLSGVPQTYDPDWVNQQLFIVDALSDPAQVDQLDRDLARLGYPEGAPGRDAAARELILFRYGKPVTTADGRAAIEMPQIGMPQGASPQPTVENTPAPQLGPNGMPTMLTRDQYQAVEQRMGKAETQAWAQRNGIKVVARTGTDANGRRVVQYTDGTIDYAD